MLRRRPLVVEAWQVTADNGPDVAAWCGGMWTNDLGRMVVPTTSGSFRVAKVGDWVVRSPFGEFEVESDSVIFGSHEAVVSVVSE